MESVTNSIQEVYKCPECGGNVIPITERGDSVCTQCGLVLNERNLDLSHNGKRAYTDQEIQSREHTGAPISNLVPDIGLTTVIDRKKIKDPDLKRAAKWDTRITWEKRNLLIATTELKRICSNLNLSDHVKMKAMRLYKEAFNAKLLRGRSINAMVAACIYYAVRSKRIPRTFQEISDQSSEKDKDIRRCYRALLREFNLKAPNTSPSSLIPKYISKLKLDQDVGINTKTIVDTFISRFATSGKDPKGIVAGAIYIACKMKDLDLTQKEIADSIGVTEVTLRSRYKELKNKLKINV
jgi:transcription initiation factor TFIIB